MAMSSPQRMAQCGSTRPDYHLCPSQSESLNFSICGPAEPHLMPSHPGPLSRRKVSVSMNLLDHSHGRVLRHMPEINVSYFLPLVLFLLCALLPTAVGLLWIEFLSYVYFCYLMCIVLLCVCIAVLLVAGLLAIKSVSGRSCDRPPRHRFFLVSLLSKSEY
jgi:hypothetical protein